MRLEKDFELRTLAGQSIVVPSKYQAVDMTKMMVLNESALVIWKRMQQGEFTKDDLVLALTDEYEVPPQEAAKDVDTVIEKMRQANMITG